MKVRWTVLADLVKGCDAAGDFRVEYCDVNPEARGEDAGTLARIEGADGILEFLHRVAGGKPAEVAAVAWTIRVAVRDLGEWIAAFEIRQRGLNRARRLRLGLQLIHMLHDVGGVERFGLAEVLAVGVVESFDLLGGWLGGAVSHLLAEAMHAKLELDQLPKAGVVEGAPRSPLRLLPGSLLCELRQRRWGADRGPRPVRSAPGLRRLAARRPAGVSPARSHPRWSATGDRGR
ncbi:MAG: hypothetical protein ABSH32_14500 [Bryobacteraceae bacterium]